MCWKLTLYQKELVEKWVTLAGAKDAASSEFVPTFEHSPSIQLPPLHPPNFSNFAFPSFLPSAKVKSLDSFHITMDSFLN